jgi:hypothetical protein
MIMSNLIAIVDAKDCSEHNRRKAAALSLSEAIVALIEFMDVLSKIEIDAPSYDMAMPAYSLDRDFMASDEKYIEQCRSSVRLKWETYIATCGQVYWHSDALIGLKLLRDFRLGLLSVTRLTELAADYSRKSER